MILPVASPVERFGDTGSGDWPDFIL